MNSHKHTPAGIKQHTQICLHVLSPISSLFFISFLLINHAVLRAQWIQQGPGPSKNGQVENLTDREVVGAIQCVAPHPSDANILYIGAVNGGVWRTSNATAASPAWEWISGDLPSQSVGGLEFDPTDATNQTLVVGLGRFSAFARVGSGNRGIFRTTTGAAPWTNIDATGIFVNADVTGIAARGATIVVATNNLGVWRTTNTGGMWTQISGAAGTGLPAGNAFDLVGDPSNDNTLYTNAGTSGIYKSTNTGQTWTKVSDAAIDADLAGAGNIEMAVGNADNVYLAIVRAGRLADVYRSGNGGGSWTGLDIPITNEGGNLQGIHVGGQGNTHLSIAADPSDNDVVYVGGDRQPWATEPSLPVSFPNSLGANDYSGRLFRIDASLAAGSQVTSITHSGTAGNSAPHADSRDMDFDANGDLIESDDGGVYKQTSPANATGDWFSLNGNLNVPEIHSIDWDANSNIIISGLQDNGVPEQELPTNSRWSTVRRGDGGDVAVDDISSATSSARYQSTQFLGRFQRRVYSTGNVFQSQTYPSLIDIATGSAIAGFSFVNPVKLNSQNGSRMIIATTGGLFESADQGSTVSNIGAVVANSLGRDVIAYGAADNADILYVGSGTDVWIRDAAAPDPLTNATAYPGGNVEGIALDPDDSQSAYVIDPNSVYETENEGGAWTDITGNLLTLNPGNFRSIAYIPNSTDDILAVGTDLGVFIAPGPNFNTWARLGTNLPQVAVFDLEYDSADDILLAGTMGRGAWTFNFSERDPVDVALVLDISGSMLSNACPTCSPKLEVLKDAVEIFMQLWKGLAVEDDRIGVVYFRTNVNAVEDGGDVLLPVIDKTDDLIASVQSQTTTPNQLTAMGGGLQSAINELTDASRPRNIILFTDGMQNVNPGVVYPSLNIENGVYGTNSNVSATTPPTTMNAALDIKVNTIGVGATSAFESQLADIATATDGVTKITTAPDEDLRQFYVEELVDVLRDFSPQLVAYRKGSITNSQSESFSINQTALQVIFKVSYHRDERLIINIYKGKNNVTKWARITTGPFYQIFSFPYERLALMQGPEYEGPWLVQMTNRSNKPVSWEIAAIADEAALEYTLSAGAGPHNAGKPLQLSSEVRVNDDLIAENVTVTATVRRPQQGLGTLLSTTPMPSGSGPALEPNLPMGARKLALLSQQQPFVEKLKPVASTVTLTPDAGRVFRADFNTTNIPGTYTILFTIRGNHPFTGPFERIEQRTVVLRFAQFDLEASNVRTSKAVSPDGKVVWTWVFTPKDRYGNYLGPDYGDVLGIQSANGDIRNVKDRGDGTYSFEIHTAADVRPNVRLGLYDQVWFDGLIPAPRQIQWFASIHAGASIPVDKFDNSYDPGIYGKIDLELRLNRYFGLQLVGGAWHFQQNLDVVFGVFQAKGYLPLTSKLSLFAEAGPGLFSFGRSRSYTGIDLGAGLDFQLSSGDRISLGGNFVNLFDHPDDYRWLGVGVGYHRRF